MIVFVTTKAELQDAYAHLSELSGGGEIRLTAEAEGLDLQLTEGGSEPVTITSADPDDPVAVSRIHFRKMDNVTVEYVDVDSTGIDRDERDDDFFVGLSENITFDNVSFTGQATGYFDPDNKVGSVGHIRSSSDITIENSSFANYFQGLFLYESSGLTIENTEFTQMQGDGLRMEGVQDVHILNNHFHDFYGSDNNYNHDDMIQMWNMNTDIISRDIEISGNVFNASGGSGSQTIFIGNERGGNDPSTYYENITVTDNVILNGDRAGIRVSATHNVEVSGNTLLWDEEVGISGSDGSFSTSPPGIKLVKVTNATISDNITPHITTVPGEDVTVTGNQLISYDSSTDADYVGNHFVNATGNGQLDLRDLSLKEDSPLIGTGAPLSQPDMAIGPNQAVISGGYTEVDIWAWSFDASSSTIEGPGVTYTWTFEDGTVLNGQTVERLFEASGPQNVILEVSQNGKVVDEIKRSFEIENRDYVVLDFDRYGLQEMAGNDADLRDLDAAQLSDGSYQIGGTDKIEVGRSTDALHNLTRFGLEIGLELDHPGDSGTFLHFANVMHGKILEDGSVEVTLLTDEGEFVINGGAGAFSNAGPHTIALEYDDLAGRFDLQIDGETVSSIDASGVTAERTSFGLNIGHTFGNTIDAQVSTVYFGHDLDRGPDQTLPDLGQDPDQAADDANGDDGSVDPILTPPQQSEPIQLVSSPELHLQLDNGVASLDNVVRVQHMDEANFSVRDGQEGYLIGGDDKLTITRGNAEIHNLNKFAFEIDMAIDSVGEDGRFLHFHKVMRADVNEDGTVAFHFQTDDGVFELMSDRAIFTDTDIRTFGISYDGDEGLLTMYADGHEAGQIAATGVTADRTYFGMTLGREWGDGLEAWVGDFRFDSDPDPIPGVTTDPSASEILFANDDLTLHEAVPVPLSNTSLEEAWLTYEDPEPPLYVEEPYF